MNKLRDEKLLVEFGDKLRTIRREKGFTLKDLAFEAEMELSQVHRIEKGKINPTYTTLAALAVALEISISELTSDK